MYYEGRLTKIEMDAEARQERLEREAEKWRLRKAQEEEEKQLRLRSEPPKGYVAPITADEFLVRFKKGERYFVGANLRGGQLTSEIFSHVNLSDVDLCETKISGCRFEKCILKNARASRASVSKTVFESSEIVGLLLDEATLEESAIRFADLGQIDFTGSILRETKLFGCTNLPPSFKKAGSIACDFDTCGFDGADFSGAKLQGLHASKCGLSEANFSNADLTKAILHECTLTKAKFEGATLELVGFEHTSLSASSLKAAANLSGIKWAHADVSQCDLSGLSFDGTNFTLVKADAANFSDCNLERADFTNASLKAAAFRKSRLVSSNWHGADVDGADFEAADLRDIKNIRFDQNSLHSARLSPKAVDAWTVLRRQYSGSRLTFHMLILVAFFLPYVLRAAIWSQVNQVQAAHAEVLARLQANPEIAKALGFAAVLTPEAVSALTSPCLAAQCREWHVWELLIARNVSLFSLILACLLILYNVARLFLTWRIGPLRDDEDRTFVTPARSDYQVLFLAHRLVQAVFFVSMASLAFHAYEVLFKGLVYLPP